MTSVCTLLIGNMILIILDGNTIGIQAINQPSQTHTIHTYHVHT